MKIAFCDGSSELRKRFLSNLASCITAEDYVSEFDNGFALLSCDEIAYDFDLTFIDLDTESMDGLDVAKEIRLRAPDVMLAFVSADPDKLNLKTIRGCIPYQPLDLLKKTDIKQIEKTISRARQKLPLPETIPFKTKTDTYMIPIRNITYIEIHKDIVSLHTLCKAEPYERRGKLHEYEDRLKNKGFYKISRSALVNLHTVRKISAREQKVTLDVGHSMVTLGAASEKARDLEKAAIAASMTSLVT